AIERIEAAWPKLDAEHPAFSLQLDLKAARIHAEDARAAALNNQVDARAWQGVLGLRQLRRAIPPPGPVAPHKAVKARPWIDALQAERAAQTRRLQDASWHALRLHHRSLLSSSEATVL